MASVAPAAHPALSRVHAIARAHGWNATSFQTLAEGYDYFFHRDGYVAYVDTGRAWVAAGAPVCGDEALAGTVDAFVAAARAAGRRACLFGVEPRLLDHASPDSLDAMQIGEQPVWDPAQWADSLRRSAGLREQLRRARAKGVTVRRVGDGERAEIAGPIRRLMGRWLATRAMPPMGFLVALPRGLDDGALFVAERAGRVVGVARLIPVPGRGGWFVENLLRDPAAPNGTVELLVDGVMRWAASIHCGWLTLGLAPLAGDVPRPLRIARRRLRWLYDFDGLRRFKAKLHPCDWVPIYLAFPRSQAPVASIFDVLSAFAPGGMLRFGARFIARGHPAVLEALSALLVLRAVLLATSPASGWLACPAALKWACVALGVASSVGVAWLARRPSARLSALLATTSAIEVLLAATHASLSGWSDLAASALACAVPALAALILSGATTRLRGHPAAPAPDRAAPIPRD